MKIPLSKLRPSRFQSRSQMNGQSMAELKASVEEVGLAVPIKVRPMGEHYEIVYGHRRVEAARQLGWPEIEAFIEELTDEQVMLQGLAENVQRDDLTDTEKGRAFIRLRDDFGMSLRQIGRELGIDIAEVSRCVILVEDENLEPLREIENADDHQHSFGDVAAKGRIARSVGDDPELVRKMAEKIAKEGLSAPQADRVAKAVKAAPPQVKAKLLEHEYSPLVHDPDRVAQQVKRTPGRDPLLEERTPKKDAEWRSVPEVKEMLNRLKTIEKEWAPAFERVIEVGKLDPAGYAFVAGLLHRAIDALHGVLDWLEE